MFVSLIFHLFTVDDVYIRCSFSAVDSVTENQRGTSATELHKCNTRTRVYISLNQIEIVMNGSNGARRVRV